MLMNKRLAGALLIGLCAACSHPRQLPVKPAAANTLEAGFINPPDEAKPRVFWWWLEGNQSKKGIGADLIAMKAAGIQGAIIFDAGSSSYKNMEKTASGPSFMGPEWQALFHHTCKIADSLNMELSLNIGSGWNDGGPWVTPELASQKLVWSDTLVEGARTIDMQLAMPAKLFTDENKRVHYRPIVTLAVKLHDQYEKVQRLENFEIKAVHSIYSIPFTKSGLGYDWNIFMKPEASPAHEAHADVEDVTDVSDKVDAQGRIRWQAPAGRYLLMRFGYTPTGIHVSTHSPGGGGLAIDYMSREAMDLQYFKTVGVLTRGKKANSLKYLHDDSWELGASNWTPTFAEAFKAANGYDIYKYLPVLTGRILGNRDVSNNFLFDFRRTIADLIYTNHYQRFADLAAKDGMGIHSESGGPHPAPVDALKNLGLNAVPMGEFWIRANTHRVEAHRRLYVKQPASAAHIYGKQFAQAEGPTSIGPHWEEDFYYMKPTLDRVYCEGLNRLVIHTFTHSPEEAGKPGNEYFAGTHFNPNVTWWAQAPAFLRWNTRVSYMLSRGLFVGDVCYYYGDNVPNQVPLKHIDPQLGEGYDYDVCNTDVILHRMQVKDGRIVLPDGMSYAVLVLPDWEVITPEVLAKLASMVRQGATIIGPKPKSAAGLRNTAKDIRPLADEVWKSVRNDRSIRETLLAKNIQPDFTYEGRKPHTLIDYIHRSTPDAEIYYVVNRNERPEYVNVSFRVNDRQPELWDADKGTIISQPLYTTRDGRVQMPLFLDPFGSTFVVFRKKAGAHMVQLQKDGKELFPALPADTFDTAPFIAMENGRMLWTANGRYVWTGSDGKTHSADHQVSAQIIDGPWTVRFDKAWGGPEQTIFHQLMSWTDHKDEGIKYYSGTAIYSKKFTLSPTNKSIFLDLGEVANIAEVTINGRSAGVWWTHPFIADVTSYLQPGENNIEIKVVNLWPNRIIGDQRLPAAKRFTRTNVQKFKADDPLRTSGLLGPVKLHLR
ncbi:glycosyl hydrolase [Chitinophaga horti]|uniref:Glycosyl hydrolase n=1 Tax=Chitinophaga horti TaxID=2920382 RepID=A0ABY6J755_9BACT|nr:glycosyl hydrolase [Chitinophaga horti]UYQ94124.1 glycosyl hydrolase [Chitinophaga horti]